MNICQVTPEIAFYENGGFGGGVENSMLKLSEGLVNNTHRLFLLTGDTGNFKKEALSMFKTGDIETVTLRTNRPILRGIEFLIKTSLKSVKMFNKKKINLIHIHAGYPHYGLIAAVAKLIYKLPTVYTVYTPFGIKVEDKDNLFLKLINQRYFLSHVDRIIAISNNVQRSLEEINISKRKIRVISPPIDCSKFNPSVTGDKWRQKLKLRKRDTMILFVGNLAKFRGIDVLANALGYLIEYPNIKLVIVLQQENKENYIKRWNYISKIFKKFNVQSNVIRLGPGHVKDMHELMAASDIFISPMRSTESVTDYPISLLEAMAVGKAVIASNVGGIPEIVDGKKTGILVEPDSPKAIAEIIKLLMENGPLALSLGREASDFIKENFSVQKVCSKIEGVYSEVMNEQSQKLRRKF